jgi:hypothetical protein
VLADQLPEAAALLTALPPTAELFRRPEVAAAWGEPSRVERYSVGGLAGHLVRAVERTFTALDDPIRAPEGRPALLTDWYLQNRVASAADLDDAIASFLRADGEQMGAPGPETLSEQLLDLRARIGDRLAAEPADRAVSGLRTELPVRLTDYLASRVVEVVVHADDVAVSAGSTMPEFSVSVYDVVLGFCLAGARQRGTDLEVLRAMTRAERVGSPAEVVRIL